MILLVDVGNSRLKWALLEDGRVHGHNVEAHDHAALDTTLEDQWSVLPVPERVVGCSVAGRMVEEDIARWARQRWSSDTEWMRPRAVGWGVTCAYAEPAQLGPDRWAVLVAAHARDTRAACIVSCGTALTVDVLGADGVHHGGVIAPGVGLMRRALAEHTAALPLVRDGALAPLARSTRDAVAAGTGNAAAALVERMRNAAAERLGETPVCLITGGAGPALLPMVPGAELAPSLVLEGVAVMAGRAP